MKMVTGMVLVTPWDMPTEIGIMQYDDHLWAISSCHHAKIHSDRITWTDASTGMMYDRDTWVCSECRGMVASEAAIPADSSKIWISSSTQMEEWVEQWTGRACSVTIKV